MYYFKLLPFWLQNTRAARFGTGRRRYSCAQSCDVSYLLLVSLYLGGWRAETGRGTEGGFFLQDHQKRRRHLCIVHILQGGGNRRAYLFTKGTFLYWIHGRKRHKKTPPALCRRCWIYIYYCGRRTVKQVASGVLAAVMVPPCRWTISRAMARPSPAPPPRLRRAESTR